MHALQARRDALGALEDSEDVATCELGDLVPRPAAADELSDLV
jgi:hypothetical protein